VADLTPAELADLLEQDTPVQVIDVREDDEWAAGRIAGSRHVRLGELTGAAGSVDRDTPVVFVCRSGGRSAMATEAFAGAGFPAHNLVGGLQAWDAAGLPLEPAGGHVA
jgi:rhodanese-related sulfurtransferase